MTPPQSLSERLRVTLHCPGPCNLQRIEAADALDAKDVEIERLRDGRDLMGNLWAKVKEQIDQQAAEIELLKEGRMLHDEHADYLEHKLAAQSALIAQAAAALELSASALSRTSGAMEAEDPFVTEVHQIVCVTLAAIRAKEHP